MMLKLDASKKSEVRVSIESLFVYTMCYLVLTNYQFKMNTNDSLFTYEETRKGEFVS